MLQCVQNEFHDSGSYNDEKSNDDQKGHSLLNADDLIKKTNLINELTSSKVLKKSYKYAYTPTHVIYKTESYPYNILCCIQSLETLNVCYPQKNKRICNILIFQKIFETVTFIHISTNTSYTHICDINYLNITRC